MSSPKTDTRTSVLPRTEFYRSRAPEDLLPWNHLLGRLDQRRARPLTSVSALAMLLSCFVGAVRTTFSDAGDGTLSLLGVTLLPPLPVITRSLINEGE
jgi:hypothetical protein